MTLFLKWPLFDPQNSPEVVSQFSEEALTAKDKRYNIIFFIKKYIWPVCGLFIVGIAHFGPNPI